MRTHLFNVIFFLFLLAGCSRWNLEPKQLQDNSTPIAETLDPVGTPTTNSAQVQCAIKNAGSISLQEYGVVYNTSDNPTTANSKAPVRGTSGAATTVTLSSLQANKMYYYRAYGINTQGVTAYGASKSFTTANTTSSQDPDFAFVQGGSFTMGGTNGQDDEKPAHAVTVGSFYLAKKEVTVKQYRDYCTETSKSLPTTPAWGWNDTHPIVNVTWAEATAYCQWLSTKTGKKYRLPTEAEWEYAAKGGTPSQAYKFAGSDNADEVAWYSGNAQSATHPVGTRPKANQLGIYDMSGNCHEWCNDWFGSTYYQSSPASNPKGPSSGNEHVFRGGSWNSGANDVRVEDRNYGAVSYRGANVGFRLAWDQ